MEDPGLASWNERRQPSDRPFYATCNAPFVSLEFDTQGFAYSCCANGTYPVGNVATDSLPEIWTGARLAAQREALKVDDLSYGCHVCQWHLDTGDPHPPATIYEGLAVTSEAPQWPSSLAFAFSNQCNLQCIQCSGEFSSSIRIHREGRPPLPNAYGDRFFEELVDFLPHVETIRLLGGEPFLVSDTYRLFDLLAEMQLRPSVHITTNGTRFDRRVEQLFERNQLSVSISIDAVTPSVLEATRVGCSAAEVMANARRFSELVRAGDGSFGINFCLMSHNWRELPAMLRLGDELGAWVSVITVHGDDQSLYKLSVEELRAAIDELEAMDAEMLEELTVNEQVWSAELDQLRQALDDARSGKVQPMLEPGHQQDTSVVVERRRAARADATPLRPWWRWRPATGARSKVVTVGPARPSEDLTAELVAWAVGGAVVVVDTDADDQVVAVSVAAGTPPHIEPAQWHGQSFGAVAEAMRLTWGPSVWLVEHRQPRPDRVDQLIAFSPTPHREKRGVALRVVSTPAPPGWRTHLAIDPSFLPTWPSPEPSETTVTL